MIHSKVTLYWKSFTLTIQISEPSTSLFVLGLTLKYNTHEWQNILLKTHTIADYNKVIYFKAKSRNLYLQKSSFSPVHRQQLVMQIRARLCQVEAEWTYMRHVHQHHTYTMELGDWHVDHNIRLWLWLPFWFWRASASMTTFFCNLFFNVWL
jgi:hypothetical protein